MWKKLKPYLISSLISLGVGGLSAFLTMDNMNLYETIETPPLSPPAILFPIVWSILYLLMGISAALIYEKRKENSENAKNGLFYYGLSLFVNFFWSIFFFNLRAFTFSFLWLICLWFLIFRTIFHYKNVSPLASFLQIPYLIWVTFAGYLNLAITLLN